MSNVSDKPDYEDVMRVVSALKGTSPAIQVRMLGASVQGREIPCVIFGDPAQGADDRQHALIISGQHGSEESGRAIAIALMRFLASGDPEAKEILRRQTVAVLPCCNPDGSQANTYHNISDINTAHDFPFEGKPVSPESQAVDAFAMEFAPELHIDIHGMAGGSMNDRVWFENVHGYSLNGYFATLMAHTAMRAAETGGYPVCEVRPPAVFAGGTSTSLRIGEKLSYTMNTLGFGLEAIEKYYTEKEWCEAGMLRLRALLKFGCDDTFDLGSPGYPNLLLCGSRVCGLYAHGVTAAQRRQNRREVTGFLRDNFAMVYRGCDGPDRMARVEVSSKTLNGVNPGRFCVSLRFKQPCTIDEVLWNGSKLERKPGHGYRVREVGQTLQLFADIEAPLGGPERFLEVRYRSPWVKGQE